MNHEELDALLGHESNAIEARLVAALTRAGGAAPRLDAAMRYSVLGGGKRLRPVLCLWTYDRLRDRRRDEVWRAALAVELIHTYSLIHDDLPAMDDDDLRRGQPACHRQFDEATAILAGDALQSEALRLLAEAADRPLAADLVAILTLAIGPKGMAGGQQLDLDAMGEKDDKADLRAIHRLKTGRMLGAAMELGARCGGADPEQRELIAAAGEEVGIAFQIVDDVLDETATTEHLGKSSGKDRAQGKLTAVLELGGIEPARAEANRLLEHGLANLRRAGIHGSPLTDLLRRLVERNH